MVRGPWSVVCGLWSVSSVAEDSFVFVLRVFNIWKLGLLSYHLLLIK